MSIVPSGRGISLPRLLNNASRLASLASQAYNAYQSLPSMPGIRRPRSRTPARAPNTRFRGNPSSSYNPFTAAGPVTRPLRGRGQHVRFGRRRFTRSNRFQSRRRFSRFSRSRSFRGRRSFASGNIYNKKRKGPRQFNRAPFRIGSFLSSGGQLPKQTFVRMRYRAASNANFIGDNTSRQGRIFEPNSVPFHTPVTDGIVGYENWQYLPVYRMFYDQYMILGCKMRISISRTMNANTMGTMSQVMTGQGGQPFGVPVNSTGYWYIRYVYEKNGEQVGSTLNADGSTVETLVWPTLRDFLTDPTVGYVKDVETARAKVGYLWPAARAEPPPTSATPGVRTFTPAVPADQPGPQLYYETETTNKKVYFTVRFSAKKHFGDKNILTNGPWRDWTEGDLSSKHVFRVLVGYIAFSGKNNPVGEVPIDRHYHRRLMVDSTVYAALQKPLITPSSDVSATINALVNQNKYKEGVESLEYSITRNPDVEDDSKSELENDLDQEIDNLLEQESDVDEEEEEFQSQQDNEISEE